MSREATADIQRLRRAQQLAGAHAAPRTPCPSPEALFDLRHGELAPAEAAATTEHIAQCPACAEALQLAVELSPSSVVEQAPTHEDSGARPSRGRAWLAGGVALLAAGVATLWLGRPGAIPSTQTQDTNDVYRGAETSQGHRTSPRAAPRDAFVLSWEPGPDGTTYDVRVLDVELTRLHEVFEVAAPSIVVPIEALADQTDGALLLWMVTAHFPDGRRTTFPTWTTQVEAAASAVE